MALPEDSRRLCPEGTGVPRAVVSASRSFLARMCRPPQLPRVCTVWLGATRRVGTLSLCVTRGCRVPPVAAPRPRPSRPHTLSSFPPCARVAASRTRGTFIRIPVSSGHSLFACLHASAHAAFLDATLILWCTSDTATESSQYHPNSPALA